MKHGQSWRQIWRYKHGRDLMNPASPTFSFSLLSTWVLRLRDLFRVRELINDRAWALIIFSFSFSPFPYGIWGLGHRIALFWSVCLSLPTIPIYPVIHVQYLQWSECSAGIEEHRSYWRGYSSCPLGFTLWGKKQHWIGNGKVEYDVCYAARYLVCV